MDCLTKTDSTRKERDTAHLNLGDVKVSDKKKVDTLAINDYSIEI
jgi:hypothetical protein